MGCCDGCTCDEEETQLIIIIDGPLPATEAEYDAWVDEQIEAGIEEILTEGDNRDVP